MGHEMETVGRKGEKELKYAQVLMATRGRARVESKCQRLLITNSELEEGSNGDGEEDVRG